MPPTPIEEVVEHIWTAGRSFSAYHLTQLLTFEKGDELTHELGSALASKGAPVRPVEPTSTPTGPRA